MDLYTLTKNNIKRYNWAAIIDDQKNSHLTIKKYCDINHIAESSFYKNKAKLTGGSSKSDRNMHSHFIPAVLTDKMLYYDYSGFWLITRKLKKDAFM